MSFDWKPYQFQELCDITRGASPRPIHDYLGNEGMPWLKIADATAESSRFISATRERIKISGVKASVEVYPGDLIVSNSATPGLPKFMKINACIHDGWLLLRNFRNIEKDFAYWLLLVEREKLVAQGNGSVFTNLKTEILKRHTVFLPPMNTQRAISTLLNELDDRVNLIRETNATLEAIAQALFKSWFVDFDPVRAKAEGRQPEGMDPATAALFPDTFEDSELGPIPKGWDAGTLADLADLNPESWTAKCHPKSVRYIDLANAKENVISEIAEYSFDEAPSRAKRVLRNGDTIVGTVRPGNRSYALISEAPRNFTGSTGFAVLRPKEERSTEFVYLAATTEDQIEYLSHVADGGAYPAVRPEVVVGMPCIIPGRNVLTAFHEVTGPIFTRLGVGSLQMRALSQIRDGLLPRLISGQLRLPEAEAQIEEALA